MIGSFVPILKLLQINGIGKRMKSNLDVQDTINPLRKKIHNKEVEARWVSSDFIIILINDYGEV